MDIYMPMATTIRHNKITTRLSIAMAELEEKKEVLALQEECALVHWGRKNEPGFKKLVDINDIDDIDEFRKFTIYELEFVKPDFLIFKKNKYLCNEKETRTAGYPDLIVEVWSESNEKSEKYFKLGLYSTSPVTEHWYIEQDSNEVICYLGDKRIDNQSLKDILRTQDGLEFDLRYLAI